MKTKKRGRPFATAALKQDQIFRAAFDLLNSNTEAPLSMRSLAAKLRVTPMALYNHFEDRSSLLRALADQVYLAARLRAIKANGRALAKVEVLLNEYYKAVVKNPALTVSLFADSNAFSAETKRIVEQLSEWLKDAGISAKKSESWRNILVDYTHGSGLMTARSLLSGKMPRGFLSKQGKLYQDELKMMLRNMG